MSAVSKQEAMKRERKYIQAFDAVADGSLLKKEKIFKSQDW
jgi:hypothetical protein